MAMFHVSFPVYVPSNTNAPVFDIRTSATDYAILRMIEIITDGRGGQNNLAITFGLGTPAAIGTARPSGITLLPEEGGSPPLPNISIGIDWTVPPTIPTNYIRRLTFNNAYGGAMIGMFTSIKIAPSSSLALILISFTPQTAKPMSINLGIDA